MYRLKTDLGVESFLFLFDVIITICYFYSLILLSLISYKKSFAITMCSKLVSDRSNVQRMEPVQDIRHKIDARDLLLQT